MPLGESLEIMNLRDDVETMPLLTYTLSSGNAGTNNSSQLFLQNSLGDDMMYLQDIEDGNTGWTLGGLPVLFTTDGQPILLNQLSEEREDTDVNMVQETTNKIVDIVPQSDPILPSSTITVSDLSNKNAFTAIESTDINNDIHLPHTLLSNVGDITYPIEIPGRGILTANGIFIPLQDQTLEVDIPSEDTPAINIEDNETAQEEVPPDEPLSPTNLELFSELSELAEVITSYKCKRCEFTCAAKNEFLEHFKDTHLEMMERTAFKGTPQSDSDNNGLNVDKFQKMVLKRDSEYEEQEDSVEVAETDEQVSGKWFLLETENGLVEIDADDIRNIVITNEDEDEFYELSTVKDEINETVEEMCILICSQCSKEFTNIDDCKQHMIDDHKLEVMAKFNKTDDAVLDKNASPIITDPSIMEIDSREPKNSLSEMTITKESVFINKANIEKGNGALPFKCQIRGCYYKFISHEVREKHEKCHVDSTKGSYKCSECGIAQKSWRTTALHLWRQHKIQTDLLACPICNIFKAATPLKLDNHMKIHGDERSYQCPDCGRNYKQASQLRNHRISHISKGSDKAPLWTREKDCMQCHKIFADSKCLKKHMQSVHSKLRPFICNVCGHSCARKAMLQMHLRQHTREKPYACTVCEYRTGDHNSLRRHTMKHTGKRPYKCPHCPYTSIQTSSYKNHIMVRHPGKSGVFVCTLCTFRTVSEEGYVNHIMDHEHGIISTKLPADTTNVNVTKISRDKNSAQNEFSFLTEDLNGKTPMLSLSVELLTPGRKSTSSSDNEDPCYLQTDLGDEQCVDTGGITIPAEPECSSLLS